MIRLGDEFASAQHISGAGVWTSHPGMSLPTVGPGFCMFALIWMRYCVMKLAVYVLTPGTVMFHPHAVGPPAQRSKRNRVSAPEGCGDVVMIMCEAPMVDQKYLGAGMSGGVVSQPTFSPPGIVCRVIRYSIS
jgi:hypothetical protein